MTPAGTALERFKAAQHKLSSVMDRVHPRFVELGTGGVADLVETLRQRVLSERLKVLIVGEFKRGKSTVINAILGAEVLPAYGVPCTAVINEIKFGTTKRAVVHFHHPLPEKLPAGLSPQALAHIQRHAGGPVPSLDIDISTKLGELEAYVAIPDPAKDHSDSVAQTPFRLVEVFWPLDLLRYGVEIIDSPGLNEHRTRTNITAEYVNRADAIVYVLSSPLLCAGSEMAFIENNLRAAGHEDIFFVCNMFDQVRERERERVIRFGRERLEPLTHFGPSGVFFVSALDALDGRLAARPDLVDRSQFAQFESRLFAYIAGSRGKLKLLQPARQLLGEVNKAINETLPAQRTMLRESTAEIEKRLEEIRPQVENTRAHCRQVLQRVERERERLRMEMHDKMEMQVRAIAEQVPGWVSEYEPDERVKLLSFSIKEQAERVVSEVAGHVESKIAGEIGRWQQETLSPFVQGRLVDLDADVSMDIGKILNAVDAMKRRLTHGDVETEPQPGALERAAAFGIGLTIGGVGTAVLGGRYGFKEMLKGLGPAVAIAIGALLLGVANPLVLIALLLGAGSIQGLLKAGQLNEKLKTNCAETITRKLKDQAPQIAREAASALFQSTAEVQTHIESGLNRELQGVTDLAESVLEEKRRGEAGVERRLATLDAVSRDLVGAQAALGELESDLN